MDDVFVAVGGVERVILFRTEAEEDVPLEHVNSQRVHRRYHRVNPDVELVAVDEEGVVDKLLHEGALRLEVEVLNLLDLDAPVVLVLLHIHLLRVEPRRRLQNRHLLRDLEGLGDVGQA